MGNEQLIISIGREFGSGGHLIAEKIAKHYSLPIYDYNLLQEIADRHEVDVKSLEVYDELPKKSFFARTVRGYNNSPQYNIAMMQFDFLRKKAGEGESFVVVGRCSETVLKGQKGLITLFVLGDMDAKIKRVAQVYKLSDKEAEQLIIQQDKKRKAYHNYYSQVKWGDSRNYEVSLNDSKIGIEAATEYLISYIDQRIKK